MHVIINDDGTALETVLHGLQIDRLNPRHIRRLNLSLIRVNRSC